MNTRDFQAQKQTEKSLNKIRRGFAAMSKEKQREIASKGGKAAHATGRAHEFTPAEAVEAGKKGGQKVSSDRAHMAEIGRMGGLKRQANLKSRDKAAE